MARKSIIKTDSGLLINIGRAYKGTPVEKVAMENPSYLTWLRKELGPELDDDVYYALEDVMAKHNVPLD